MNPAVCITPGCLSMATLAKRDGLCSICRTSPTTKFVDLVNAPPHYRAGGIEAVDTIEAFGLGWHLGDAVAYILRAGRKGDALEDLRKARWHLDREISIREKSK
jgi:hypothetical protein